MSMRAKAVKGGRAWRIVGVHEPRGPLDFERVLRYQLRQGREPVDRAHGGRYRRALRLPGGPSVIEVRPDHPRRTRRLEVAIWGASAAGPDAGAALEQVADIYSLAFELPSFHRAAREDRVLDKVVKSLRGLRVARIPDPFEALVWAILGQQISVVAASALKRRLVEELGDTAPAEGEGYALFPTAARLHAAGEEGLRRLGLSGPKARYVFSAAEEVATGRLDLEALRNAESASRTARLLEVRGIGPWSASYVGLRAYGDPDALPLADVGLEVAATRAYEARARLRGAALGRLAEAWRPYRGWATFYLWYTLLLDQDRI